MGGNPVTAIDSAIAYLEHTPVTTTTDAAQQTFDGFFVSLIMRSWWLRIALGLLIAVLFGGQLLLGSETKGALNSFKESSSQAAEAIEKEKTKFTETIKEVRLDVQKKHSDTIKSLDLLAKDAETRINRKVLDASTDIVDELKQKAKQNIEREEARVIRQLGS